MSVSKLSAESRARTGSGVLKQMRREGLIPCVVYGGKDGNVNLKVVSKTFNDILKEAPSSNILLDLEVDGKVQQVFIQAIQFNDLKQQIVHIDFLEVDEKTQIKANIPLVLKGLPKGVKLGGLLEQMLYTIPIKCLPQNLPVTLSAEVEHLGVSEVEKIKDVKFPEGVECQLHGEVVIARVAKTRVAQAAGGTEEE